MKYRAVPILGIMLILLAGHSWAQQEEATASGSRKVVNRVAPMYPVLARPLKLSGSVKMEAVVAMNGNVKSVQVRGGNPILAQAAENAVRQWRWEPAPRESHEPVEVKFAAQ